MTERRDHCVVRVSLAALAAWLVFPAAVLAQVMPAPSMQPASSWTVRASAGPATSGADGSQGGPQLQLAVERALSQKWSVRIESRTLWTPYDPAANPAAVTSTTQLGFGAAMIKIVRPSPLTHAYVGGGAAYLVTSFHPTSPSHDHALGLLGIVGVEFHPQSRRWNALIEVFLQGRPMPVELANGQTSLAQIGISFGVSLPVRKAG